MQILYDSSSIHTFTHTAYNRISMKSNTHHTCIVYACISRFSFVIFTLEFFYLNTKEKKIFVRRKKNRSASLNKIIECFVCIYLCYRFTSHTNAHTYIHTFICWSCFCGILVIVIININIVSTSFLQKISYTLRIRNVCGSRCMTNSL